MVNSGEGACVPLKAHQEVPRREVRFTAGDTEDTGTKRITELEGINNVLQFGNLDRGRVGCVCVFSSPRGNLP